MHTYVFLKLKLKCVIIVEIKIFIINIIFVAHTRNAIYRPKEILCACSFVFMC